MESLLIIFFILLTSVPLSSPSRSYPHHNPAVQSMNKSGFSFPIYHVWHPMVQKQLDSFAPISKDENKTKFLMKVNLGTPMVSRFLVLDTGSDLCWILEDGYNRSASSSLYKLGCRDERCESVPSSSCSSGDRRFSATYADGTTATGDVLLETFYLYEEEGGEPTVEFQMPFGLAGSYGFKNQGVVGMNFGNSGLLSFLQVDKFSVCFPDPSVEHSLESFVRFGDDALLFGPDCVYCNPDRYHLTFFVSSIKIAGVSLSDLSDLPLGAYFILDTGAVQSYVTRMDAIVDALRKSISDTEAYSPNHELCYTKRDGSTFQNVDFSFDLGEDKILQMTPSNIWEKVSKKTYCLAMKRSRNGKNILGMTQMIGKYIGFDRTNRQVCFRNEACSLL